MTAPLLGAFAGVLVAVAVYRHHTRKIRWARRRSGQRKGWMR